MRDKKKLIALILFLIIGFFMFTFANPSDGIEEITIPVEDKDNEEEIKDNKVEEIKENNGGEINIVLPVINIDNAPVITVEPKTVRIVEGTEYDVMTGVTATDDKDKTLEIKSSIIGVGNEPAGTLVVTYTVTDSANNTATATRTITILEKLGDEDNDHYTNEEEAANDSDFDNEDIRPDYQAAPTITNNCASSVTVYDEIDFESCITATDEFYGTDGVTLDINSDDVDFNNYGKYTIEVTATDNLGNETKEEHEIEVTKRAVTVTIDNKEKKYLEENEELTSNADEKAYKGNSIGVTLNTSATKESTVGEYDIKGTYSNDNYDVTFVNGTYKVTKATIADASKATLEGYNGKYDGESHTYTFDGKDDDTFTVTSEDETIKNVGEVTVTGTVSNPNYEDYELETTLKVTKATASITANAKSSNYGKDIVSLDYSNAGFIGEDFIAGDVEITTTATKTSNVGTYPITLSIKENSAMNKNYNVTLNNSVYTITKATIADADKATLEGYNGKYDGESHTYTFNGKDDDTFTVTSEDETIKNVGEVTVTGTVSNPNYEDYELETTLKVTKATASITANAKSSNYGKDIVSLDYSNAGFIGEDFIAGDVEITTTATKTSNAGTYPITLSIKENSAMNRNYNITLNNSIYTINKINYDTRNIKVENVTVNYDGKTHNVKVSGVPAGINVTYTVNSAPFAGASNPGIYNVTVNFSGDINHNSIESKTAVLTINNLQTGIVAELKSNAQLQFQKGSTVNIKDYINVYRIYADNTRILTDEYITDLSTANIGRKTLTVRDGSYTDKSLTYNIINEEAFQTKFEVIFTGEKSYRKTNSYVFGECTRNCDSNSNTSKVKTNYNFLEVVEHYDEVINVEQVEALYTNSNNIINLNVSNMVRWTHINDGYYNPVYIATRNKKDVMDKNNTISQVYITYTRLGNRYKITFRYDIATNKFIAVDEVRV